MDLADEPARIRVDEYVDDRTLVMRAELSGVDPAKDIEVSVANGVLHIRAERPEKGHHSDKDLAHSVLRYGSFKRSVPLPEGVRDEDIKASYKDGLRSPNPDCAGRWVGLRGKAAPHQSRRTAGEPRGNDRMNKATTTHMEWVSQWN